MKKSEKPSNPKESWMTKCGIGLLLLAVFLLIVALIANRLFDFVKIANFLIHLTIIAFLIGILGTVVALIGMEKDIVKEGKR